MIQFFVYRNGSNCNDLFVMIFSLKGNGTVDFNEFLGMMAQSNLYRRQNSEATRTSEEEEMRQAFRIFDIDGNGYIDEKELKLTMCNLGEDLSDKDIKKMMRLADKNGDGKIDYEGMNSNDYSNISVM